MDKSLKLSILLTSTFLSHTVLANDDLLPLAQIGETDLQQRMGQAVQSVCIGFLGTPGIVLPPEQQDLFNRCGEMVNTANRILGNGGATGKDLGVSASTLASYLQQVAGEEVAAQGNVATDAMMGQSVMVADRLASFLNVMGGVARVNHHFSDDSPEFTALGIGASSDTPADIGKWGVYASVKGGTGEKDTTDRENGFDLDDYQVLVGMDYMFNSQFVAGVAYGYRDLEADYFVSQREPGALMDATTDTFTVYSLYQSDVFYISAVLDYGTSDFDSSRRIDIISETENAGAPDRTLTSSTESSQYALALEAGYHFVNANRTISPYVQVRYLDMEIDAFAEQDSSSAGDTGGGLALAYQEQNIESLKTAVGGQISWSFNQDFGVMSPYLMAEWLYEHKDDSRAIKAQYVHDPRNIVIDFFTDEPDSDYFNAGVGVSFVFPNGIQAFVDASTTLGLEDFDYSVLTAGVRLSF